MSEEDTESGVDVIDGGGAKTLIRTKCDNIDWVCGSETHAKFTASLRGAMANALEDLPRRFTLDYSLDDVVSEALPRALKQFAEDVAIWPGKPETDGDMGIVLVGLDGDFEMRFDLGEMLLDELRGAENPSEVAEDRAKWLEHIAAKIRREATSPDQESSTAAVPSEPDSRQEP